MPLLMDREQCPLFIFLGYAQIKKHLGSSHDMNGFMAESNGDRFKINRLLSIRKRNQTLHLRQKQSKWVSVFVKKETELLKTSFSRITPATLHAHYLINYCILEYQRDYQPLLNQYHLPTERLFFHILKPIWYVRRGIASENTKKPSKDFSFLRNGYRHKQNLWKGLIENLFKLSWPYSDALHSRHPTDPL